MGRRLPRARPLVQRQMVEEETEGLTNDDETDNRYKLEDKKRKIAQEIDSATKNKRLQLAKEHYFETKEKCETIFQCKFSLTRIFFKITIILSVTF